MSDVFVPLYLLNETWVQSIRHRVGASWGFLKPNLRDSCPSTVGPSRRSISQVAWHSSVETALLLFNDLLRCVLICRPQCRYTVFWTARRRHSLFYELRMSCRAQAPFLNQHNMQIEISCKITFRQTQSRNRCLKNTNAGLIKYFIIKYFIHFKNVICENRNTASGEPKYLITFKKFLKISPHPRTIPRQRTNFQVQQAIFIIFSSKSVT